MNTKAEEALKVLDEQHDDYLQAGEYSGEGCWFGHNFAADYAKEYAAARTTLAAHIAQQDATIARMREALEACIDYGSMTDDGWVTDKARAALNQENANGT